MRNGNLLALTFAAFVLTACDGGGSGGKGLGSQNNVTTQQNTPRLSNVNGALRGMYFSSAQGDGDWLNLETGETGSMYSNRPGALEAIVPAPYGTEYLEYYHNDSVWSAGTSVFQFKNWQTGLVVDSFEAEGEASSRADTIRISPDGQTIGFMRDQFDTFDFTLTFFRRTGERIAEFAQDNVGAYAWIDNQQFVFAKGAGLHLGILSQDSIRSRQLVSLQNIPGWPRNINVSPDGQYLVFEMVTAVPPFLAAVIYRNASVYRMRVDGTELSLVATMTNSTGISTDEPRVNNPLWSLDGQFLMMSAGVSSAAVVFWDTSYSPVTDDYVPLNITDVISASSEGFMYLLPDNASDVVLLNGNNYPVIAYNNDGKPAPYQVSSLHIEPGAVLVEAVERLPETVAAPSVSAGSLMYLRDDYGFDHTFAVMEFDARSASERTLFEVRGTDFDDVYFFGVSRNKQLFAMWDDQSYDEKYLRIFDSTGTQREYFQMVYYNSGTKGRDMYSPPQFSPVNDNWLLYRFLDEETEKGGFGVLDWTTGRYIILDEDGATSVAWAPDGSIILSQGSDIYRMAYANNDFATREYLFSTPNFARGLNVNAQGTKLAFTQAGHLFHANMDGSDFAQLTAPSTGREFNPVWSPDGRNITFMKEGRRYIASAGSRNLQAYPLETSSTNKLQFVTGDGGSTAYWR